MKKRILTIAASMMAASALAVTASAAFVTPTGNPTTYVLNDPDAVYEDGDAWVHIINPNNNAKMFDAGDTDADTKDVIICFDISGCDGSYKAFAGFGINSWTPSVWNEQAYTDVIGGVPDYVIDHDGSYEMIIPFNLFMAATAFADPDTGEDYYKEYLEAVDCLELCIRGVPEDTTTTITVTDVRLSNVAHSIEECADMTPAPDDGGSSDSTEQSEEPEQPEEPEETPAPETDGTTTTAAAAASSSSDNGALPFIIGGVAAAVVVIVVIVIVAAKKKK